MVSQRTGMTRCGPETVTAKEHSGSALGTCIVPFRFSSHSKGTINACNDTRSLKPPSHKTRLPLIATERCRWILEYTYPVIQIYFRRPATAPRSEVADGPYDVLRSQGRSLVQSQVLGEMDSGMVHFGHAKGF